MTIPREFELRDEWEGGRLEFYKQTKHSTYDDYELKHRLLSLGCFRDWVTICAKAGKDQIHAFCSTRIECISRYWLGWQHQHILVLDVDSLDESIAAARVLKRRGINWAGIESSPGHYWMVTDKVGPFREMYKILETIPGVDDDYVEFTKTCKKFFLRGISNKSFRVKFGDADALQDNRVIEWYHQFKALHNDPIILENLGLINHLRNGTIASAAADPSFDV